MKDWIKVGNEVYASSYVGYMNSGNDIITKVGRTYFYLGSRYRETKIRIEDLVGMSTNGCYMLKVYPNKETYEREVEVARKRRRCEGLLYFLTNEEIEEFYDKIESRKIK